MPQADRQHFVAGTWYLGGSQLVGTASTYALLYVLTRLGTEAYGLWVLAVLLAGYLTPWATLGLSGALMRFCPSLPSFSHQAGAYRMACRASLLASILAALVLVAASRPLAVWLLGGEAHWLLVVLAAVLFPLEAQFQLGNSFLQVRQRPGVYAALASCRNLAEVVVLAVLVWWLPRLEVLLAARALILAVLVVAQHLLACRGTTSASRSGAEPGLSHYLRFGFPMIPATFIWALIAGADRFMLNRLADLTQVALYNAADTVAVFLLNYTRPINGMLQPRLANLIDREPAAAQRHLGAATKFLGVLLFPGAVGLALVADTLVALMGQSQFGGAARMVPVLGLGYLLIGLTNPIYHLVFLRRGGRVFPGLYAGCLAVNLALNWLLIPLGGGMGAALATLGAFVVYGVGLLALAEPTDLAVVWGQWRSLALAVGCSLGMGAALLAAAQTAFFSDSVLLVPLGILVYTLLLGGSGLVSREEWALIAGPLLRLWRPVRPGT